MARLDVINLEGQKTGDLELDPRIFDVDVKDHVFWEVIKSQLASKRAGTHSTLRRSEVRGGGKKPYKQKGTGRARQGSTRSPQFVGGGSVFGPKPRDYSYNVPKKVRALALCGVLSARLREKKLIVVDNLAFEKAKTKEATNMLANLGLSSVAILSHNDNTNLSLSVRNLKQVTFLPLEGINVYDLVAREAILLTPEIIKTIERRLAEARGLSS